MSAYLACCQSHGSALAVLAAAVLGTTLGGCTRQEHRREEIKDEVAIVASREGWIAERSIKEVARYGRDAIPHIESALPKASVTGQLNLVTALRRIGDVEAVPLLRHVALRSSSEAVRTEAELTLKTWARGDDERARRAKAAVRAIEEHQGRDAHG